MRQAFAVAVCLVVGLSAQAAGVNLLVGGDCASGRGWDGGERVIRKHGGAFDAQTFRSAPASIKLTLAGAKGSFRTSPRVKVQPNAAYRVSFASKAKLSAGEVSLSMRQIHSPDGKSIVYTPLGSIRGVHNWTVHSKRIIAAPNADSFQVYVNIRAAEGEAWLDDLSIVAERVPTRDVSKLFEAKPKAKPDMAKADLSFISTDFVTPHRTWAKPLAGGPLRALVLVEGQHQREIVELIQRMDIRVTSTFMMTRAPQWALGDYYKQLTLKHMVAHAERQILSDAKFDAMLFSGSVLRLLGDEAIARLDARCAAGAGLVLVAPDKLPPALAARSPVGPRGKRIEGRWTRRGEHVVTSGINFAKLPPTRAWRYEAKGCVVAEIAGAPLIVLGERTPRTVAFTYSPSAGYFAESGLVPNINFQDNAEFDYDYWEGWYGLVAKALLWAAGREAEAGFDVGAFQPIARAKPRKPPTWDDFPVNTWSNPVYYGIPEHLMSAWRRRLADMGINCDIVMTREFAPGQLRTMREAGFALVFGKFGYGRSRSAVKEYDRTGDKFTLVRKPCLSDPAYRESMAANLREWAAKVAPLRPLDYCMGDENELDGRRDLCYSPYCLERFRGRLRQRYRTLDALNAEWDTAFATWDAVVPMTQDEVRGRGNYAPWADHREFMEWAWAEDLRWRTKVLREIDPRARVAFSGTQQAAAYKGWDWYRLCHALSALHGYGGPQFEQQRSFDGPPNAPWCAGYGQVGDRLHCAIWNALLHGAKGVSAWGAYNLVNPDLTLPRPGRDLKRELEPLEAGLGRWIAARVRDDDPIALHYSMACIRAAYIEGHDALRRKKGTWAVATMIEELGFQYKWVSTAQIERGGLANYKVLLMPYSAALSDAEADAIRSFVSNGGMAIADVRTGAFTASLKPRAVAALDDVFGLKPARHKLREASARVTLDSGPGIDLVEAVEDGIELAAAKPLGKRSDRAPAVVVNLFGQGRAAYFGCTLFDSYPFNCQGRRVPALAEQADAQEGLLARLLAQAGLKPRAALRDANGRRPHFCEIVYYRDAIAVRRDYAACAPNDAAAREVALSLPKAYHVIDKMSGQDLGVTQSVRFELGPATVKLFELRPAE